MKKTFCGQKFKSLLFTATFSMIIEYIMLLSDTIIIGNIFGENGIAAINVVAPVFYVAVFLGTLNSIGTSVCYSYEMGKFDNDKSDRLFGQGVIIAVTSGMILFLIAVFGKGSYFSFMNVSDTIAVHAREYYTYYQFVILVYPLYSLLLDMVYTDGDEMICNISYIVQIIGNISSSILLCNRMGVGGASLGTFIGTILSISVLVVHFFRKQNSLKFVWYIKGKDILKVIKCGLTDAIIYLLGGMVSFIASKFIIVNFGEYYLPVLSVVVSVIEMTVIFDGIGQAITPLINVYRGEDNYIGIKKTMNVAVIAAIIEGIVLSLLLVVFGRGRFITGILGIKDATVIGLCEEAIRFVCPFFVCTSLLFLMTTYYLIMEKEGLSLLITVLKDFIFIIIFMLAFGICFGIKGMWAGFGVAPLISFIVSIFIIYVHYGKNQFPFLLNKNKDVYSYDIYLSKQNIMQLRDDTEKLLIKKSIDRRTVSRIMLLIEEVAMLIYEKNNIKKNSKKKIFVEFTLIIDKDIQIIIRDNGIIFDVTDADNKVSSMRGFVVANMMSWQKNVRHLVTTSFNRNSFTFEK